MVSGTRRVAVALAALAVLGAGAETAAARSFDLEGHRGTRGLRPENTLAAFGKAMEIGVTTLELDTGVTKDGVVVVSHERRISSLECQGPHVGKLIHELTYAQIQKLDCGTRHRPTPRPTRSSARRRPSPARTCRAWPRSSSSSTATAPTRAVRHRDQARPDAPQGDRGPDDVRQEGHRRHLALPHDQALGPSVLRLEHAAGGAQDQAAPAPRGAGPEGHDLPRARRGPAASTIKPNPFNGDLARVVADKLHAQVLSVNYPDITDALIKRLRTTTG